MNTAAAAVRSPEKTVADVMTTSVITLKLDDILRLTDDLMNLARLRYFPVMDDDHLVGVVNESDLFHASIRSLIGHPKDGPRAPLGEVKVRDVMKPATTVSSNTSVHDAAELVVEHGIESVVVMEGEKIVGVVARTALLRELAKR